MRPEQNEVLRETFEVAHGYNPDFLRRVREKRRAEIVQIEREVSARDVSTDKLETLTRRQQMLKLIAEEERARILAAKAEKERQRRLAIARLREAEEKMAQGNDHRILAKDIVRAVAAEHNVTFGDIVGPRRSRWLIPIRFEAIRRVADMRPDLGMPAIGRPFNRDHTTILHALKKTAGCDDHWRSHKPVGKH